MRIAYKNTIKQLFRKVHLGGLLIFLQWFVVYKKRVLADSGEIGSDDDTKNLFKHLSDNGTYANTLFLWAGELGRKERTSTIYKFLTKGYDMSGEENDMTQTTEADQPYLSGNIAPNEKLCLKNPNGDGRYGDHPAISFTAAEAWSVTTVINHNGSNNTTISLIGNGSNLASNIYLKLTSDKLRFQNESGGAADIDADIEEIIGKITIITLIADGLGSLKCYRNGSLINDISIATDFIFSQIIKGNASSGREFFGKLHYHRIQSGEMDSTQVTAEYNMLRTLYPEIETVTIGSQEWATSNCEMVATPEGNVIAEVTENANVEKVVNGSDWTDSNLDGLADNWSANAVTQTNSIVTGNGFTGNAQRVEYLADNYIGLLQAFTSSGKWFKCRLKYRCTKTLSVSVAGGPAKTFSANTGNALDSGVFYLLKGTGIVNFRIFFGSGLIAGDYFEVDDFSAEEVGWAGSQDLYDGLIAQGESVQTALEASAFWCHYNNDSANGALYGKLYNFFAIKLLQTDIDTYNASNPDWGYHVPTQAEFTTLQTTLGGASVAGGKMKVAGTDYWNTPNTGADNSSGFSGLPSGYRTGTNGGFAVLNNQFFTWGEENTPTNSWRLSLTYNNSETAISATDKDWGFSIRLIKD